MVRLRAGGRHEGRSHKDRVVPRAPAPGLPDTLRAPAARAAVVRRSSSSKSSSRRRRECPPEPCRGLALVIPSGLVRQGGPGGLRQVEARILEGAAKAQRRRRSPCRRRSRSLVIAAGVLRTRAHEIEERDVRDAMRP